MSKKFATTQRIGSVRLLPKGYEFIGDAAQAVEYSRDYIRDLLQTGKIRGQKLGAQWIVEMKSLKEHKRVTKPGPKTTG